MISFWRDHRSQSCMISFLRSNQGIEFGYKSNPSAILCFQPLLRTYFRTLSFGLKFTFPINRSKAELFVVIIWSFANFFFNRTPISNGLLNGRTFYQTDRRFWVSNPGIRTLSIWILYSSISFLNFEESRWVFFFWKIHIYMLDEHELLTNFRVNPETVFFVEGVTTFTV